MASCRTQESKKKARGSRALSPRHSSLAELRDEEERNSGEVSGTRINCCYACVNENLSP